MAIQSLFEIQTSQQTAMIAFGTGAAILLGLALSANNPGATGGDWPRFCGAAVFAASAVHMMGVKRILAPIIQQGEGLHD